MEIFILRGKEIEETMITVQMNIYLQCDNPNCNETLHYSGYFPLGANQKDIFEQMEYELRWTHWRYRKTSDELFCSVACEEKVYPDEN